MGVEGLKCVVTGGSGLVGQRLVEMLVERGAARVVSFDIVGKPQYASDDDRIVYLQGDLGEYSDVENAVDGADCVWHIGALVGPFHPFNAFRRVNYEGTLNVIKACQTKGVKKIVMSSSPSTRFTGNDIDGERDCDMEIRPPGQFLEPYAETKAMGEIAMREACCDDLMTVCIAPHQVYGPRDALLMPNIFSAAAKGKLWIFGEGRNKVAVTYVDNYCHGLIIGYDALYPGSPALGKFYVVTDGGYQYFWDLMDTGIVMMGYAPISAKFHLPLWLLWIVAYMGDLFVKLTGRYEGRRRFALNPFTLKMMTIHRWFDITPAKEDLKYEPVITTEEAWKKTIQWYKDHPEFLEKHAGIKPGKGGVSAAEQFAKEE